MYVKHCKLTRYQQLRLMEYFVAGTPARTVADLQAVIEVEEAFAEKNLIIYRK